MRFNVLYITVFFIPWFNEKNARSPGYSIRLLISTIDFLESINFEDQFSKIQLCGIQLHVAILL